MTCFLIDDEPHCTDVLRVLLQRHCPEVEVTGIFNDPEAALEAMKSGSPELVLLDIEMPVLNGFEWLRRCPAECRFHLIFTTAYDQYAVKAFRFNAIDYLLKPIDGTELREAVEKSKRSLAPAQDILDAVQYLRNNPVPDRIALPLGPDLLLTDVADIVYCASDGSYVEFYLRQHPKPVVVSKSLREVEELLNNPALFFRCHNSFLVNLRCIKKIVRTDGAEVVLFNERHIPVARTKKAELLKMIARL